MKIWKWLSQINFYEKKFDKTENEKTEYYKNKTKTNKYCSIVPLLEIKIVFIILIINQ